MRFIINPETDRVIVATGQAFEAFNLTPERADVLLQAIDAAGGRATTGQLAQALGCNIPDASRLLGELSDRGSVRSIMEMHRPIWERRTLDVNSALIREEHAPRILAFLVGRRELPGAIASALGLPRDEIAETCKFLMVSGQLVGTHIGAATVYALDIRGTTRVDVEAAARVAPSPQARFLAELAALPPVKLPPRPVQAPAHKRTVPSSKAESPVREAHKAVQSERGPTVVRAAKVAAPTTRAIKPQTQRKATRGEAHAVKVTAPRVKVSSPILPRKSGRKPKTRARAEVFPEGFVRAIDAARDLGIKPAALYKWIEHHAEARALCAEGRKHLMVPPEVLAMYTRAIVPNGATFATEVPEGWLDIWQTVEALGWSYSKVYKMLDAGRLRACEASGKLRFDPDAVQGLKAELDAEEAVPQGWASLRALAAELGLHISSVTGWVRRHKYETRKYRDADRQLVVFAPDAAASAYRAAREATPGGLKLTPEMREAIRSELPPLPSGQRRPPCEVQAVANQYGVSVSRVHKVLAETSTALAQAAD